MTEQVANDLLRHRRAPHLDRAGMAKDVRPALAGRFDAGVAEPPPYRTGEHAETFSETGPTLWTVLSVAAGGIKVPPPTPSEHVGEPAAQTTLYIVVIGTDGYETVMSEGEIDEGFGNAPILLGYAEDGVVLSQVPYNSTEYKGPAQLVVPTDTHGGPLRQPDLQDQGGQRGAIVHRIRNLL
jgi:hypothetical protein